jgi:hypothetical protein
MYFDFNKSYHRIKISQAPLFLTFFILTLYLFLWEEENLIEPKKRLENNGEAGLIVIIKTTKKKLRRKT